MKIQFYDFETKTVNEMPEDELAPGCIKVRIQGMEGEYFVSAETLKQSAMRHAPFNPEMKEQMRYLENVFREVFPQSAEKWEEGFRRDTRPKEEIDLWLNLARHYQHHTQDSVLSLKAKKEYFSIILQFFNSGEQHVRQLTDLEEVSEDELQKVLGLLKNGLA